MNAAKNISGTICDSIHLVTKASHSPHVIDFPLTLSILLQIFSSSSSQALLLPPPNLTFPH
ncbi:hypothetical protein PanWU01x14_066930 [Parasponia andersonii]|uniref:Uncharacterized protein n=1 Tax=Parasponia andersonii TaxID=3476 RepID=A0A2P5DG65_PARAD|nr:hypothetical protein PanWU01x14_066930 [Parasponia andersonii]